VSLDALAKGTGKTKGSVKGRQTGWQTSFFSLSFILLFFFLNVAATFADGKTKEKDVMHVPSYQINNVLKVYSKQVSQSKALNHQKDLGLDNAPAHDKITLSAEGKRKAVIDKVASDIINRLTSTDTSGNKEVEVAAQIKKEKGSEPETERKKNGRFVYNYIGEDNEKTTSTLSVGNNGLQAQRMKSLVDQYNHNGGNPDPEESHENL